MYHRTLSPKSLVDRQRRKPANDGATPLQRRKPTGARGEPLTPEEPRFLSILHFPILKGIKEDTVAAINRLIVGQRLTRKQHVYLPYDLVDKVYFIRHGNVEIGYLDESGRELTMEILGPGDLFGAFIDRGYSGTFARAMNTMKLGALNKNDFDQLLERYPRLSAKMIALMNHRINNLETKLRSLVFNDVRTRICRLLHTLFLKAGDKRSGQISIPLTHQDIANQVASSRETASLHLSEMKKLGIITYERKRIKILKPEALLERVI